MAGQETTKMYNYLRLNMCVVLNSIALILLICFLLIDMNAKWFDKNR